MTPYEQIQQALAEAQARDDAAWPEQETRLQICQEFAGALLAHVRTYLGVPREREEKLVYFRRPHLDDAKPDGLGNALQINEGYYEIELDVLTELASGKNHALFAIVHIIELGGTRYKIAWDGKKPLENEVEVDSSDPSTFLRFSSMLAHDILEYYRNSQNVGEYARSRIGFAR